MRNRLPDDRRDVAAGEAQVDVRFEHAIRDPPGL